MPNEQATNKMKSSGGRWLTESLFIDMVRNPSNLYTLRDTDQGDFPSLYRLYMAEKDIYEVHFARKYLGGYAHWKVLQNLEWFKPHIAAWREELELELMSDGLRIIQDAAASTEGRSRMIAAKFLIERSWDSKLAEASAVRRVGRPSKQGLKEKVSDPTTDIFSSVIARDYDRLLMSSTNGGTADNDAKAHAN